jgi:hypothetical protein
MTGYREQFAICRQGSAGEPRFAMDARNYDFMGIRASLPVPR